MPLSYTTVSRATHQAPMTVRMRLNGELVENINVSLVCLDSRIFLVGYCDYDHCRLR